LDGPACQSSGKARTIKDPTTGKAYANAQVPVSTLSPASLKLMQYVPTTSDPCGKVLYGIPDNYAEDQYIGRVDYVMSSKQSLFGRYFIINYSLPAYWDPKNILVTQNPGIRANLDYSMTILCLIELSMDSAGGMTTQYGPDCVLSPI
jgi:hypothetical protein